MRGTRRTGVTAALAFLLVLAAAPGARAVEGLVPAEMETVPGRTPDIEVSTTAPDLFDAMRPDAVVELRESVFNEAAAAIEPIRLTGRKEWRVPDWVPVVGGNAICDPEYTADVTGITLGIAPEGVGVHAHVRAHWCGQAFTAEVDTTGDVAYDPAARHILVTIDPTSVTPRFVVTIDVRVARYQFEVPLPVTIDLAGITAPPIRVQSFFFTYETSRGSGTLHGTPRDLALIKRQGYVELQSDLRLW